MNKTWLILTLLIALTSCKHQKYRGRLSAVICTRALQKFLTHSNIDFNFEGILQCDVRINNGFVFKMQVLEEGNTCNVDLNIGLDGIPNIVFEGENYCRQLREIVIQNLPNKLQSEENEEVMAGVMALTRIVPELVQEAGLENLVGLARNVIDQGTSIIQNM